MKLHPTKRKLINLMREKGRILTEEEAFDFYIENVMRNDVTCRFNPYRSYHEKRRIYDDYPLCELEQKARSWHFNAVGSLVVRGFLQVDLLDMNFKRWVGKREEGASDRRSSL